MASYLYEQRASEIKCSHPFLPFSLQCPLPCLFCPHHPEIFPLLSIQKNLPRVPSLFFLSLNCVSSQEQKILVCNWYIYQTGQSSQSGARELSWYLWKTNIVLVDDNEHASPCDVGCWVFLWDLICGGTHCWVSLKSACVDLISFVEFREIGPVIILQCLFSSDLQQG